MRRSAGKREKERERERQRETERERERKRYSGGESARRVAHMHICIHTCDTELLVLHPQGLIIYPLEPFGPLKTFRRVHFVHHPPFAFGTEAQEKGIVRAGVRSCRASLDAPFNLVQTSALHGQEENVMRSLCHVLVISIIPYLQYIAHKQFSVCVGVCARTHA